MARKIYMKFSDERNLENSIRTVIRVDNGRRSVIKQPIFKEGAAHIRDMYEKADLLKKAYSNIKLNNAVIDGDLLQCDYVEGKNLTEFYLDCILNKDKEKVLQLIDKHMELVKGDEENQCYFYETDESKRLFGDLSRFAGAEALKITNYEATANNIYLSGKDIYFIDYEWVFDFPLPVELVIYHCIVWTGYLNMPQLTDVISKEELMQYLHLDNDICNNHINYINYINYITENSAYYLAKLDYAKGKYSIYDIDQIWLAKMEQQQKYIDNLEAGMMKQQEYIGNLETGAKGQQEYIDNLEKDKERQQEYIDKLREDAEEQQKCLIELEENVERKQENIQDLEKLNREQQERISYLDKTLAVQNKYASNLENKIERYIEKQKQN